MVLVDIFSDSERMLTEASVYERHSRLSIERTIIVGGDADLYAAQSDGSAVIAPPAPFSGDVDYRPVTLGGSPWDGSLSALFPGIGVIRLAGSQYSVSHPR